MWGILTSAMKQRTSISSVKDLLSGTFQDRVVVLKCFSTDLGEKFEENRKGQSPTTKNKQSQWHFRVLSEKDNNKSKCKGELFQQRRHLKLIWMKWSFWHEQQRLLFQKTVTKNGHKKPLRKGTRREQWTYHLKIPVLILLCCQTTAYNPSYFHMIKCV